MLHGHRSPKSQIPTNGIAFCLLIAVALPRLAAQQDKGFPAPTLSCFDPNTQPLAEEVHRTPVLVSPNRRYRAFARVDAHLLRTAAQPCRTKAQLFVSAATPAFQSVFVEEITDDDDAAVSLGPIAWSPDSRWLAVERAAGYYASDFGDVDLLIYDSSAQTVTTPNVFGAIAKALGKDCVLAYQSFGGFDKSNRLIVRIADWQDDDGRESYCVEGTAEWLFDPVTGEAQPSTQGKSH